MFDQPELETLSQRKKKGNTKIYDVPGKAGHGDYNDSNISILEAEAAGSRFEASLEYVVKKKSYIKD